MRSLKKNIQKGYWVFFIFFFATKLLTAQPVQVIQAPAIVLPDSKGNIVQLSDYRGNLVLVDFWASWCGPCRVANKGMVKIYERFKEKGLVMLSVSLDTNKLSWERAVKKDRLDWTQLIDVKAWKSEVAAAWDVNYIPASFLIDQEGNIVADHLEGRELEILIAKLLPH